MTRPTKDTTQEKKSYKCDACGGWIDYTGEEDYGMPIVRHRSKAKGIKCEKLRDKEFCRVRANNFWIDFDKRKELKELKTK